LETLQRIRALFQRAGVFEKAEKLIEKFRVRAEAVADDVEPTELRELLYFLVDTVLDRSAAPAPEPESLPLVQLSK
jgi:ABC-type hemin transport system substrate-binding protein